MKIYELITDWQGLKAGTKLYGRYPIIASAIGGYFTQENIPTSPEGGSDAFFASAIENDPTLFKLIEDTTQKTPA